MQVSRKLAWPLAAALSATMMAGWSATTTATAAETVGPSAVEDFSYPGAAKVLADHRITLKSGDGHIVLADCGSGTGLVQLYSRAATPSEVCFQITGPTGYLSLEIPQVYNIRGDAHAIKATLNTAGTVTSVDVNKNDWTPVGEGSATGTTTLLELNATDGPAAPSVTNPTPAIGAVTVGQPGRPGSRGCSGTLIAAQWVLSAASCFSDDPTKPAALAAGAPSHPATVAFSGHPALTVTRLVPRTDRDVVLAHLSAPITDISPAQVGTSPVSAGQTLSSGGFGRTATDWVPAIAHVGTSTVTAVTDSAVTVTPTAGTVCKGDTGGPAFTATGGGITVSGVHSLSGQAGCLAEPSSNPAQVTEARVDDIAAWITANATGQILGDFNGDGRADMNMAYYRADGSIGFYTSLSDASGSLGGFNLGYTVPAGSWDRNSMKLVAGDFNGDGRTDLAMMYHHADGSITLHTGLADAKGLIGAFQGSGFSVPASAGWDWNAIQLFSGDFNGDGRAGLAMAYYHADGSIGFYTSLS
ncbi:trypsin-like serine protease, partial [Kitasatospora sp. NPDC008050]|uniref:trypsin-like serine protease n=1 Tax=Kitasatospora sp. NPDC008050 TaxID=3364021 RepID=UPI0036E250A7